MGYFPNGDAGLHYEAKYCDNCWHQDGDGDGETSGCMVWFVHLADLERRIVLDAFIPMDADGIYPQECKMFLNKKRVASLPKKLPAFIKPCEGQRELFERAKP